VNTRPVLASTLDATRHSGLFRDAAMRLLRQRGERRVHLFGAPLVIDPHWEVGYTGAGAHRSMARPLDSTCLCRLKQVHTRNSFVMVRAGSVNQQRLEELA
jgi:hypothetical protein